MPPATPAAPLLPYHSSTVNDWPPFALLADAVLILHSAIALFVLGGLVVILLGNRYGWSWVNELWFRLAHLATITVITAQAWLGATCPLTTLEMWLREKACTPTYGGRFVGHWLQRLLYYDASAWIFTLAYSLFGLAILATWWYYPPHRKRR